MKNLNVLLQNSSVLELNSVEMEEIVGGSWFSRLVNSISNAIESVIDSIEAIIDFGKRIY
jgi:hypothetical protein